MKSDELKKDHRSVRGTVDFDPVQTALFNKIVKYAREILKLFAYQEIMLPILEEEGVFRKGLGDSTDIVERQMFKIASKDEIILRPEGTAQVIRYYLENSLDKQNDFYKFSYIGSMFRGERPQKGRLRQFNHVGVEAIGSDSPLIDAEIIALSIKILDALEIKNKQVEINSLGCAQDKQKFTQELKKDLVMSKSRLCEDCTRRLEVNPLRVLDCKQPGCREVVSDMKSKEYLCHACATHFKDLCNILDSLKIKHKYNPLLVRGLDYYTNTVFEIVSENLGAQSAIGAGGRYNNLIKSLGGPQIPAVGFALGIERIMLLSQETQKEERVDVFMVKAAAEFNKEAFEILYSLREKGISCDMDYLEKSLKAQLRRAQKKQAKIVLIIGEDEWKTGTVTIKNMQTSFQNRVKISDLVTEIKNLLS